MSKASNLKQRCLVVIPAMLAYCLLAGGHAAGQGASLPSLSASPASPAVPAAKADDGRAAIQRQLDSAKAELVRVNAPPPAAATPDETLERNYLTSELVTTLERHLDILNRLPEAQRNAASQDAERARWAPAPSTTPVSIMAVDRQHQLVDDTEARLANALMREGIFDQQITEKEQLLKSAEVAARQITEKLAGDHTDNQKSRDAWLLDMARLRARTAAAELDEAKDAKTLGDAEIGEARSLAQLQHRQLDALRTNVSFSQAELDAVLSDLDRQITDLQGRQASLQKASVRSHELLNQAEQAASSAHPDGGAASDQARREQAVRQLQADTDDLAVDMLRGMIQLRGWERAGWQFRWYVFNTADREKRRSGSKELATLIGKLDRWSRYLQQESARTRRQLESVDYTAAPAKDKGADDATIRTISLRRADILNEAQQAVDGILSTFRVWQTEIQDAESERTLSDRLHDAWSGFAYAVQAVWNFEILTAQDEMEVDGRRITAARSITVGKMVGVILLVVLGAMLSRQTLNAFRRAATRHFSISANRANTVARWINIVVVSLLFLVALYLVNIPLTVFAFLGGALAIGVGFGTQVMLKNMISGVMLLVERPLRVGDRIEVGSVVGTVTEIKLRSSTVRTSDGIEILVPNSTFIESNVTNWTYSNARVRRSVSVGTNYAYPPETVAAVLKAVPARHPFVLKDPAPQVLLDNFGEDAINFTLRYWIDYAEDVDASKIASDLRFMIAEALQQAGISIPLPQSVVSVKSEDALQAPAEQPR